MAEFDKAREDTQVMFDDLSAEPTEEQEVDTPADEEAEVQTAEETEPVVQDEEGPQDTEDDVERQRAEDSAEDAANVAEAAALAARERDQKLQETLQEMQALRQRNEELEAMVGEISDQQKEAAIEEALAPPVLDVNALAFADEATVKAAQAKYAQDMAEYLRAPIMKELAPFIEQAKKGQREAERDEYLDALSSGVPELADMKEYLPQMEQIIKKNKVLSSDNISTEDKYLMAYAIARGVDAMNTPKEEPKEPTADDFMALYEQHPEFQELLEKKRIEAVKGSQQVPPFSASSGAVNAALNIKSKPETFEDASERTRRMFGAE